MSEHNGTHDRHPKDKDMSEHNGTHDRHPKDKDMSEHNGAHDRHPHPVRIDLPDEIRLYVIQLLQQTLACTVDLRSHVKQAGWNVKGREFSQLHALFATMATDLDAYTDLVAERLVVLGGVARGTIRAAATQSTLPEYPGAILEGQAHVLALAERFEPYAMALRDDIARAADVEDAGSAALYTEISRGIDQQLSVLDAHLPR